MRRTNDEIGDVEGQEAVAIETARVSLGQHKGLSNMALCIDMTEIGSREESVVTTGAEHEPAGVGAPVVERLCIVGVGTSHGTALSCLQVEQPEVGLMVPDAELSVVRECIAQESSVVGGTGEGDGTPHPHPLPHREGGMSSIDDGFYLVAELARGRVEVDAAEVIADGVQAYPRPLRLEGESCPA